MNTIKYITHDELLDANGNITDILIRKINSKVVDINIIFRSIVRLDHVTISSIKQMIDLGAEPDCYAEALHYCFKYNDIAFARHLIEDIGINFNKYQFRDLDEECLNKPDLIKLLIDNQLILTKNVMRTFLHFPKIVKLLLDLGLGIQEILAFNTSNINKEVLNLLIEEIQKSNSKIDKILLSDIFSINYERHNLSLNQIKLLVDAGANPRHDNDYAFVNSCSYGNIETVKYFLYECGCDINARNSYALTTAIYEENFNIAKFLIDSGIKITDKNIISGIYHPKFIKLFLDNDVNIEYMGKIVWSNLSYGDLDLDEKRGHIMYMKELVKLGVDFNQIILG
jgi:hypothetical protein